MTNFILPDGVCALDDSVMSFKTSRQADGCLLEWTLDLPQYQDLNLSMPEEPSVYLKITGPVGVFGNKIFNLGSYNEVSKSKTGEIKLPSDIGQATVSLRLMPTCVEDNRLPTTCLAKTNTTTVRFSEASGAFKSYLVFVLVSDSEMCGLHYLPVYEQDGPTFQTTRENLEKNNLDEAIWQASQMSEFLQFAFNKEMNTDSLKWNVFKNDVSRKLNESWEELVEKSRDEHAVANIKVKLAKKYAQAAEKWFQKIEESVTQN